MSKRRYTRIKEYEAIIIAMRESGRTAREIADELGVERQQIKWWVSRYNKRQAIIEDGKMPKAKGRPRKDGQPPRQDPQKELERLRMENKLLRDFLQSVERK
jgi:transposase-like protein